MKRFFSLIFLLILVLSFISADDCVALGDLNDTHYCDSSLVAHELLADGESCLNDYECVNYICTSGICEDKFDVLFEEDNSINMLSELLNLVRSVQCDPAVDTGYHCEGTVAYLCGENNVWEEKGEVVGVCGFADGSGSSSGGSSNSIHVFIFSPRNVLYSTKVIPLNVIDAKDNARYWKYSLNGGEKQIFTPNTTITADEGQNVLKVWGSRTSSSTGSLKSIVFTVQTRSNIETVCGNGYCDYDEYCFTCEADCGICPIELGSCGDGVCNEDESSFTCSEDCFAEDRGTYLWIVLVVFLSLAIVGIIIMIILSVHKKQISPVEGDSKENEQILNKKSIDGKNDEVKSDVAGKKPKKSFFDRFKKKEVSSKNIIDKTEMNDILNSRKKAKPFDMVPGNENIKDDFVSN